MVNVTEEHLIKTRVRLGENEYPGMSIVLAAMLELLPFVVEDAMFKYAKYVDVTTERNRNVEYTNNTGSALILYVRLLQQIPSGPSGLTITVDGNIIWASTEGNSQSAAYPMTGTVIVPAGSKYKFTIGNGGQAFSCWEYRVDVSATKPSWKNLTTSRQLGVEYTNSSKDFLDISVIIKLNDINQPAIRAKLTVDGLVVNETTDGNQSSNASNSILVRGPITISSRIPPGAKYKIDAAFADFIWNELTV